jgi:protein-disulfide isomerase
MRSSLAENVVLFLLLACALTTTGLLARREIFLSPETGTSAEPVFVERWRDALKIGLRTGPSSAAVEIVEFADFQCPYCARFDKQLAQMLSRSKESVAITLVHYPIAGHKYAEGAARAAECADDQGRFAAMQTILFEQQKFFGDIPWIELGRQALIPDTTRFQQCVDSTTPLDRVIQGKKLATVFGIKGTPTILINGWMLPGPPDAKQLERIVSDAARGKTPKL